MNVITEEWISCYDPNTNTPYYYNTITGISQWELPETSSPIQYNNGPGGIRPQNSIEENIPTLIKMKSKSGRNLGSFRAMNKKIVPIATDAQQDETPVQVNDDDPETTNILMKKDSAILRKSRPTVKLKGTPLLNLKRALSNQQLEIDTGSEQPISQSEFSNVNNCQIDSSTQFSNNQSAVSSPVPARDYIELARCYQKYRPFSERYFNSNTKCILCNLHTPVDILFPCNHRCICRTCLEHSPYNHFLITPDSHLEKDLMLQSPVAKQQKIPCPLCNLVIKQIIPMNDRGTEEKEYWDWLLASGNGPGGPPVALDSEFLHLFSENLSKILEKSTQNTQHHLDSIPTSSQEDEQNYRQNPYKISNQQLNHESDENKSEIGDSFPQFSAFVDRSTTSICCSIQ